ncbi:MAG: copper resistance protein B [Gammaproteobacteria bacterium WSBS_2016_MAG_OTU1]
MFYYKHTLPTLALILATLPLSAVAQEEKKELTIYGASLEELEYRRGKDDHKLISWDGDAFIGNDKHKVRWITEGEYDLQNNVFEQTENRLVAQIPVSMFFDVKTGVRLDTYGGGQERWHAVMGATGLAPQWFEVDADFFVGESGRASTRLDAEYELLLTNHLFAIFSAESTYSFAADKKAGIGTGVTDLEVGARLSYDIIDRSVAPYIGAVYEKKYGDTAAFAREEGESDEGWFFVVGVRLML